jgi:hypothetical protein
VRFYEPVISNRVINVVEANREMLAFAVVEVKRGEYINFFIAIPQKALSGRLD